MITAWWILPGGCRGWTRSVGLIGSRFVRSEPRARVGAYVRGLLAGLERKNGWTLAEHAGAVSPDGMQRLLRTADWDVDGVRDDVRGYVLDGLGDPRPTAGCSSSTTPGSSRRAAARPGCSGSTPAPAGRSTTVSWGCSWPTPRPRARPDRPRALPARLLDRRPRPLRGRGDPAECCETASSRPSPSWSCAMLEPRLRRPARCRGRGSPPTRRSGRTRACATGWPTRRSPTCWPPATTTCSPARTGTASRPRCWPPSPASTRTAGSTRPRLGAAQPGLRRARRTGLRLDRGRAGPGRAARRVGALAAGPPADRHPAEGKTVPSWRSTAAPAPPPPRCGS